MDKLKNKVSNRLKAVLLTLGGCALFTTAIALSRIASAMTSVSTILFFQYFICMILLLPKMIQQGGASLRMTKIGVIMIRSVAGYLNYALIIFAVEKIPLVNVILLNNTAPLFIPLIIFLWKGVKINPRLWVGILVGFCGIAIVLRPNHEIINIGGLIALGSALCVAISMIAQRRLVKSESIYSVSFYYFLISSIISLPFMLDSWAPLDQPTIVLIGAMGILFICGQILVLNAFKYEKPSFLSLFNYSSIVYGALIEWLFWDRFPGWLSLFGIAVICLGGLITIRGERRKGIIAAKKNALEEKPPTPAPIEVVKKDQSSN